MRFDRWTIEAGRRYVERADARARQQEMLSKPGAASKLSDSGNLPLDFLQDGLKAAQSVVRLRIRDSFGLERGVADGILVGENLVLTCHQTLPYASWAVHTVAEATSLGDEACEQFALKPMDYFHTDEEHDYTLVAIEGFSVSGKGLASFERATMAGPEVQIGQVLSLVHHPRGNGKRVSIRACEVLDVLDTTIHLRNVPVFSYGGALFNDDWQFVAMIHSGIPVLWPDGTMDVSGACLGAEAVLASSLNEQVDAHRMSQGMDRLLDSVMTEPTDPGLSLAEDDDELIAGVTSRILAEMDQESGEADDDGGFEGHDVDFLGEELPIFPPLMDASAPGRGYLGHRTLPYTKHTILYDLDLQLPRVAIADFNGKRYEARVLNVQPTPDPRLQVGEQPSAEAVAEHRVHPLVTQETCWGRKGERASEDVSMLPNMVPVEFSTELFEALRSQLIAQAEEHRMRMVFLEGPNLDESGRHVSGIWIVACWAQGDSLRVKAFLADGEAVRVADLREIGRQQGLDFGRLTQSQDLSQIGESIRAEDANLGLGS